MRIPAAKALLSASLFCAMLGLQGCAIYSETRHKQAIAAQEAWNKVDLTGQMAAARKQEAALLSKQMETEEQLKRDFRDKRAFDMVLRSGSLGSTLLKDIEGELKGLVDAGTGSVANAASAKTLLDTIDKQLKRERDLKEVANEFARFRLEMPSCADIETPDTTAALDAWIRANPGARGNAVSNLKSVAVNRCHEFDSAKQAKTRALAALGGTLKQTMSEIESTLAAQETARGNGVEQRNRYRAAAQELDTAMKALEVDPAGARSRVDEALGKMKKAVGLLAAAQDTWSASFVSQARIDWLNTVLTAVETSRETGKPPEDGGKAARILSEFPGLIDSTRVALADAQKPRLAPLVLMKDMEKIKADVAARALESQLLRERLQREKLKWEIERLRALHDAYLFLTNNCGACLDWTLADALQPVSGKELVGAQGRQRVEAKANVLKAASLYLDAQGRLAASANKTAYQLHALRHEEALAGVEGNIAQWNTLISSSIAQLNDYTASRVKSEEIGALINAAALLWIGKGVN